MRVVFSLLILMAHFSSYANSSQGRGYSEVPRPSRVYEKCSARLRALYVKFTFSHRYCSEKKYQKIILDPLFVKCHKRFLALSKHTGSLAARACVFVESQRTLNLTYTKSYLQCTKNFKAIGDSKKIGIHHLCLKKEIRVKRTTAPYFSCMKKIINLNLQPSSMNKLCLDSEQMSRINRKGFDKCMEINKAKGSLFDKPLDVCLKKDSLSDFLPGGDSFECLSSLEKKTNKNHSYKICSDRFKQREVLKNSFKGCFGVSSKYFSSRRSVDNCIDYRISNKLNDRNIISCIEGSLKSTWGEFLSSDKSTDNYYSSRNPSLVKIMKACDDSLISLNSSSDSNKYIKLINSINIHNGQSIGGNSVGGLSAIKYDKKHSRILLVSDKPNYSNQSNVYSFEAIIDESNRLRLGKASSIHIKQKSWKKGRSKSFDLEGLAIDRDGGLLLSFETLKKEDKSYIQKFNNKGFFERETKLPVDYMGKWVTEKYDHTIYVPKKGAFGKKVYKDGKLVYVKKVIQKERSVKVGGFEFNKGLESLSLTPDKSFLFTANENSLSQDKEKKTSYSAGLPKKGDLVRILKMKRVSKNFSEDSQYYYEIDAKDGNGLVDMLAIDEDHLLTMERRYDRFLKKVSVRLYLVNLKKELTVKSVNSALGQGQRARGVKKTFVADLDSLLSSLPKGFKKIDNIEGVGFGPEVNGEKTLLFVSDNNFNNAQQTQVLFTSFKLNSLLKDIE